MCEQSHFPDFAVRGPRTALWTMRFMVENGGTPLGRHARFRSDGRFSGTDPGIGAHENLCKMLQVAMTYDQ
eukprot:13104996-Heterocapsa_arctica.AAC.1